MPLPLDATNWSQEALLVAVHGPAPSSHTSAFPAAVPTITDGAAKAHARFVRLKFTVN
jgi:hypothetical protein